MKYIVSVIYSGKIDMEVEAPGQDDAEEAALDEIDSWTEELFIERLELEITDIKFLT